MTGKCFKGKFSIENKMLFQEIYKKQHGLNFIGQKI